MSLPVPQVPDVSLPPCNRNAMRGFTLGLLSLVLGIFASIPALIFLGRGLREIQTDPAHRRGRGLARLGLLAALVALVLQPVLLFGVAVPFVSDEYYRAESAANLQFIGKAWITHTDNNDGRMLPFTTDANKRPLLSWRVLILPELGERELYAQIHLDEPWDSPHNLPLVGRMPKVYAHPADSAGAAKGSTHYRVILGRSSVFGDGWPLWYPASFINDTSQTILVAETADAVPWTKPDELWYDPSRPIGKQFGGLLHDGFNVVMADGKVRFIRYDVKEQALRKAIGEYPDGIGPDW